MHPLFAYKFDVRAGNVAAAAAAVAAAAAAAPAEWRSSQNRMHKATAGCVLCAVWSPKFGAFLILAFVQNFGTKKNNRLAKNARCHNRVRRTAHL